MRYYCWRNSLYSCVDWPFWIWIRGIPFSGLWKNGCRLPADWAVHSQVQGCLLLLTTQIPFYIAQAYFWDLALSPLVMLNLVSQHLIVDKTYTSKRFGKHCSLFVIWIYSGFIRFIQYPDFLYIFWPHQWMPRPLSTNKSFGSKNILSIAFAVTLDILFSRVCCWHFYRHSEIC